jgi:hypothetical protein
VAFRREAYDRPDEPLQVEIGMASESQFFADISGRVVGVFASTFLVLSRDTPLELIIAFPDGRQLKAWGVVQFVRTADDDQLPGLGVAFTKVEPVDYAAIVAFGSHRAPMFHDDVG